MRIVAELGINTNGDLDTALRMVEAAAEAGVDAIKVQAYDVEDFLPPGHPDWNLFKDNRLSWLSIERVQDETLALGLDFGATPTSTDGVERLAEMKVDWLKNGSDFLLRHDLIDAMLATGIETWVSVGMASNNEVIDVSDGARLMACTSAYPCPDQEANLLRLAHPWVDGYSDHTTGSVAAVMAVALEAQMYEFHLTLDHDLPGPDHAWSRSPAETAILVTEVRRAEAMLGSGHFKPSPSEEQIRDIIRVHKDRLRS